MPRKKSERTSSAKEEKKTGTTKARSGTKRGKPASPARTKSEPTPEAQARPGRSIPVPIVGVGASAGGLEALSQLLGALPDDTGMAFVLVCHLSHTHKSLMSELPSKQIRMPVGQVTERTPVEPNHVYVIPPNMDLAIDDGYLVVSPLPQKRRSPMVIDSFLRSLAEKRQSGAIGVILSGTGTDGTLGLAAIKAEGGIAFAQDEESAKYADMPRSASAQPGSADFVLPPDKIAAELARIAAPLYVQEVKAVAAAEPTHQDQLSKQEETNEELQSPRKAPEKMEEIYEQEKKCATLQHQLGAERERHETVAAELETINAELEAANAELQVMVSEREAAKKEAEEKEREFRLLAENVPELFSYVGPDERYRFVNQRYEEFFGLQRDEIVGKHVRDLLSQQEYDSARSHIEAALSGRRDSYEHRVASARGDRIVHVDYVPDVHQNGRVSGFYVLVRDVTQRREAEKALKQENVFRSAILNTMDALVVVLDRDGRIVSFNRACERSTGYSFEEVAGKEVWELLLDPQERDAVRGVFANLLEGNANRYTNRLRAKDGKKRLISWSNTFLTDDSGIVEYVIGTGIDITERKRAEDARDHAEAQASALLETAAQAILAVDTEGRIRLANATTESMFGYPRSELLGRQIELLVPDRFRDGHARHRAEYVAHPRNRPMGADQELYGKKKDGTEFPIEVGLSYVEPRDGLTSVAFISDITERKQAQEELSRSQEQLRALAARLVTAHEEERRAIARDLHDDLTQKLAVLGIELGLLGQQIPEESSDLGRQLAKLSEQVREASEYVRQLSHQLHPSVLEHGGLEAALRAYCGQFASLHGMQASVRARKVPDDIPRDVAGSLYSIAQEALQNASKHSLAKHVQVHLSGGDGYLRLTIIDDGQGFDEADTRAGDHLGLVSMEERARLIGGSLEIQSVPGEGTRVRVETPLKPA